MLVSICEWLQVTTIVFICYYLHWIIMNHHWILNHHQMIYDWHPVLVVIFMFIFMFIFMIINTCVAGVRAHGARGQWVQWIQGCGRPAHWHHQIAWGEFFIWGDANVSGCLTSDLILLTGHRWHRICVVFLPSPSGPSEREWIKRMGLVHLEILQWAKWKPRDAKLIFKGEQPNQINLK